MIRDKYHNKTVSSNVMIFVSNTSLCIFSQCCKDDYWDFLLGRTGSVWGCHDGPKSISIQFHHRTWKQDRDSLCFFLIITFPLFSNLFFFLVGILLFYLTNSNLPKATGTESRANLFKEDESEKYKRQLSGHKTSDTLILANPDSNV